MWFAVNAFLQPRSRPLNLGHRGASADAPENTLAAFRRAAELGADGIEFDAKLSRDGVVVILHDATVDRTTDGSGRVSDLSLAELKQLDAGAKFSAKFAGERIPTLEETLDAIGDRLLINIELTNYASRNDGLEAKVLELMLRHPWRERIMLSSFNPIALRRVKRAAPQVVCGLLTLPGRMFQAGRILFARLIPGLDAHHPHHSMTTAGFVRRAHARGQKVNTWTVNAEAEMRRLIAIGVDALMTDQPDVLRRIA